MINEEIGLKARVKVSEKSETGVSSERFCYEDGDQGSKAYIYPGSVVDEKVVQRVEEIFETVRIPFDRRGQVFIVPSSKASCACNLYQNVVSNRIDGKKRPKILVLGSKADAPLFELKK